MLDGCERALGRVQITFEQEIVEPIEILERGIAVRLALLNGRSESPFVVRS